MSLIALKLEEQWHLRIEDKNLGRYYIRDQRLLEMYKVQRTQKFVGLDSFEVTRRVHSVTQRQYLFVQMSEQFLENRMIEILTLVKWRAFCNKCEHFMPFAGFSLLPRAAWLKDEERQVVIIYEYDSYNVVEYYNKNVAQEWALATERPMRSSYHETLASGILGSVRAATEFLERYNQKLIMLSEEHLRFQSLSAPRCRVFYFPKSISSLDVRLREQMYPVYLSPRQQRLFLQQNFEAEL